MIYQSAFGSDIRMVNFDLIYNLEKRRNGIKELKQTKHVIHLKQKTEHLCRQTRKTTC